MIDDFGVCMINGAPHAYDGAIYSPASLGALMIRAYPGITERQRKETTAYLRESPFTPWLEVSKPELIPLRSRVYDIDTDQFCYYSPNLVFLNRFPYDYAVDAPKSDCVDEFLFSIADGNPDIIELILEVLGNVFLRVNRYRAGVMFFGPGCNGKSSLLNLIAQLFGNENISHLSLQDTCERFRTIGVYGKAANIGDDIPDKLLNDSSVFKKLITGETIIAERKGVDPVEFKPYCKFFLAANNLPPVSDRSRAFYSRMLIIPLNHDFSNGGNAELKDRTWTEQDLTYLTRLAIEALKRVRKHGGFYTPDCVKELVHQYEVENNPILSFLEDFDKELEGVSTTEVYAEFERWCAINGHRHVVTKERFSREVRSLRGYTTTPRRKGGQSVRVFTRKV